MSRQGVSTNEHDPRRGDRDEWTIGVNKCHRTLATMGACGRQHKGVVRLVLEGPTPGSVVRRQERLRHSAEIIQYAELAERCPMTTRHLVMLVKQQRLPDSYESQMSDWNCRTGGWRHTQKYIFGTREAHEGERG